MEICLDRYVGIIMHVTAATQTIVIIFHICNRILELHLYVKYHLVTFEIGANYN